MVHQSQNPLDQFTLPQQRALLGLRTDYQQGVDPPRIRRSLSERVDICLRVYPLDQAAPPLQWTCLLQRIDGQGRYRDLLTSFCTVPESPQPPSTREVLYGIAMGVAHWLLIPDLRPWALRYRINQSGFTATPCYRGIIRRSPSHPVFYATLAAEYAALTAFLDADEFSELMAEMGVEQSIITPGERPLQSKENDLNE